MSVPTCCEISKAFLTEMEAGIPSLMKTKSKKRVVKPCKIWTYMINRTPLRVICMIPQFCWYTPPIDLYSDIVLGIVVCKWFNPYIVMTTCMQLEHVNCNGIIWFTIRHNENSWRIAVTVHLFVVIYAVRWSCEMYRYWEKMRFKPFAIHCLIKERALLNDSVIFDLSWKEWHCNFS